MIDLQSAAPDDRETVLGLVRAYFAFDGLAYTPAAEAAITELLSNPRYGRVLLARQEDAVVGYAALTYGFDHEAGGRLGVLTDLFLVEAARGRGLGRALLDGVLALARAEGLRQVDLWVLDGNDRARALYRSRGFGLVEGRRALVFRL